MLKQQNQSELSSPINDYPHPYKQSPRKTRQNYDFSDCEQDYDQPSAFIPQNRMFSNQIDFLGAESLQTIQRESLQIVPQIAHAEYPNKTEADSVQVLKTSRNSLLQDEKENESQMEQNLIIKASELTLESSISSIAEELCGEGLSYLHKVKKQKSRYIKSVRQLIRELKREWGLSEQVFGDGVLKTSQYSIIIKQAKFESIMSSKGHLGGLIINNEQNLLKIKVEREEQCSKPRLQIWDEKAKSWQQFQFKIKIYSI